MKSYSGVVFCKPYDNSGVREWWWMESNSEKLTANDVDLLAYEMEICEKEIVNEKES